MSDCWELVFGEFAGCDEYDDTFFISWPDKKYSVIDYSRKINNMSGRPGLSTARSAAIR